jgi:hypothetical protein
MHKSVKKVFFTWAYIKINFFITQLANVKLGSNKGRTIRNPGRGYNIFAARFFFSLMSLQDFFFMHLISARIFSKLFALCCLLARFFLLWRNGCANFFSRHFSLHEFFGGNFPPLPGISNGPPLNAYTVSYNYNCKKLLHYISIYYNLIWYAKTQVGNISNIELILSNIQFID